MDDPSDRQRRARPRVAHDAGDSSRSDARAADEAAADRTRRRLREQGIVPIEPDDRIGVMLAPDEQIVAVRRSVSLERRQSRRESSGVLRGDLYVTTRRLIHLGLTRVEYALGEIQEAVIAEGALRLVVGESRGLEIGVRDPRVLRVEIAAVREDARAAVRPPRPLPGPRDRMGTPDEEGRR